MIRPKSNLESLAAALKLVVGGALRKSFNGQEVWRDDYTWRELSGGVIRALAKDAVVLDKATYVKLMGDSTQLEVIRNYVEEFKKRQTNEQKANSGRNRNAYAQWASENMPPKEGT